MPQLIWGAPPGLGCPRGSLGLSLSCSAWLWCLLLGLACEEGCAGGVISPRVPRAASRALALSLPLCFSPCFSPCFSAQHSQEEGDRQSGRLRDTQAPDSHFPCAFPFSHPPHHLWLCLSGSSLTTAALGCARRSSLTNSQQQIQYGEPGGLTWLCHPAETLPCHPCPQSSALHHHPTTGSATPGVFSHKSAKSPHRPCLALPDKKDEAEASTESV